MESPIPWWQESDPETEQPVRTTPVSFTNIYHTIILPLSTGLPSRLFVPSFTTNNL